MEATGFFFDKHFVGAIIFHAIVFFLMSGEIDTRKSNDQTNGLSISTQPAKTPIAHQRWFNISITMLQISHLKKTYTTGDIEVAAVRDLTLEIGENEFVAIMGPSGSGKSTLMNILGCLDQPTSGSYKLAGREVSAMDDDELAAVRNRDIGFVFQSFHLQPRLDCVRNVMLPLRYSDVSKEEARQRAERMLERVGLGKRLKHLPNELSGGQRQRVAIARALVNRPKIIFADEPTGALDSKTSVEIMELFTELHRGGQTIILVTHEAEIAEYAQKVIHMRDGEIEKVDDVKKVNRAAVV